MTSDQSTTEMDTEHVFSREKLVVTMPALYRPEVLATTLWSFERGLFRQFSRRTLILNVDPLGVAPDALEDKKNQILALAYQYFDNVIARFPSEASFPGAVQWLWQQALTMNQCFLHLEDDWILNRSVPVHKVLGLLSQPNVASVRLQRQRHLKMAQTPTLSLNPVFLHPDFIRQALKNFQIDKDPEKQFMLEPLATILADWPHFVMPATEPVLDAALIDIAGKAGHSEHALNLVNRAADRGGWVSDLGVHWRKSQDLKKISEQGASSWQAANSGRLSLLKNRLLLQFKLFFYRKRLQLNSLLLRDN
jgi:hypothetical protein